MKTMIKHLDSFDKHFVVDNNNHVIAATDTHLARCIGENANWQPMRKFQYSPRWSEGFSFADRLYHLLGTSAFTDKGEFYPRPTEVRKVPRGESYNHQTRAFSLLNPSRLQEGTNILGVTEITFDILLTWMTPKGIDRAVLYALSIVSQAGWKVDETFTRFTLAKEMVTPGAKIKGIILGSCTNWLEALLCATLISAGYFVVCYDSRSTPSKYYPAMMDVIRYGIHPLYFNDSIRSLSYVYIDDICYPLTTDVFDELNPESEALVILSRAKDIHQRLAHCGAYPLKYPAEGELRKISKKIRGSNLAIHHMPSARQFGAMTFSDLEFVEDSIKDAANLVNYSVGELFGFGLNEYDPHVRVGDFGMKCLRPITNDAFDEDVKADDLYDDVTKYSDEKVVVYESE